jgi:hypothetical protein
MRQRDIEKLMSVKAGDRIMFTYERPVDEVAKRKTTRSFMSRSKISIEVDDRTYQQLLMDVAGINKMPTEEKKYDHLGGVVFTKIHSAKQNDLHVLITVPKEKYQASDTEYWDAETGDPISVNDIRLLFKDSALKEYGPQADAKAVGQEDVGETIKPRNYLIERMKDVKVERA